MNDKVLIKVLSEEDKRRYFDIAGEVIQLFEEKGLQPHESGFIIQCLLNSWKETYLDKEVSRLD